MTDYRKSHANTLGYFLILSTVGVFAYNYIHVAQKLGDWNQSNLIWDVLGDTIPIHIITVFLGLFAFSLRKGLEAGHPKAILFWTILCIFLLGDSAYTLTVKFHILVLLKALFFAYLTIYALSKVKKGQTSNDQVPE